MLKKLLQNQRRREAKEKALKKHWKEIEEKERQEKLEKWK